MALHMARAGEALSSPDAKSPLRTDLKLELDEFPLEIVPELHNKHVAGNLSGTAELRGLGTDARFSLELGSKRTLAGVAARFGLPVPATLAPRSRTELDAAIDGLSFPLLVKPEFTA